MFSPSGFVFTRYVKAGQIVPVEVTLGLLRAAIDEHCRAAAAEATTPSGGDDGGRAARRLATEARRRPSAAPPCRFLIEGFPRTAAHLDGWLKLMASSAAADELGAASANGAPSGGANDDPRGDDVFPIRARGDEHGDEDGDEDDGDDAAALNATVRFVLFLSGAQPALEDRLTRRGRAADSREAVRHRHRVFTTEVGSQVRRGVVLS